MSETRSSARHPTCPRVPSAGALALLALTLAACTSTPLEPSTPSAVVATPGGASTTTQAPGSGASTGTAIGAAAVDDGVLPPWRDPANPLSRERSVYFGFDDYAVTPEAAPVLQRHGSFLASQPQVAIRIEGHTDDRGGAEYNLALGQRRAEAVRQALRIYGVSDNQMETISWGSEKPKALGQNEQAWAQNRRADLVYPER